MIDQSYLASILLERVEETPEKKFENNFLIFMEFDNEYGNIELTFSKRSKNQLIKVLSDIYYSGKDQKFDGYMYLEELFDLFLKYETGKDIQRSYYTIIGEQVVLDMPSELPPPGKAHVLDCCRCMWHLLDIGEILENKSYYRYCYEYQDPWNHVGGIVSAIEMVEME